MGYGIFFGIVGIFTAIFIGVKVVVKCSENRTIKKEQQLNNIELEADAEKYARETDLFDKEISCPYEDKTTRSYQSKSTKQTNKKNKHNGMER